MLSHRPSVQTGETKPPLYTSPLLTKLPPLLLFLEFDFPLSAILFVRHSVLSSLVLRLLDFISLPLSKFPFIPSTTCPSFKSVSRKSPSEPSFCTIILLSIPLCTVTLFSCFSFCAVILSFFLLQHKPPRFISGDRHSRQIGLLLSNDTHIQCSSRCTQQTIGKAGLGALTCTMSRLYSPT